MNEIQKELNVLYLDYLKKLTSDEALLSKLKEERISPPVLLYVDTPHAQYVEADVKILYVGKENNGWMNDQERITYGLNKNFIETEVFLNALLKLYKDFNLGRGKKQSGSAVFSFQDILLNEFRKRNFKPGILWSNLIRVDCVLKDRKDSEHNKQLAKESKDLKNKILGLDSNKTLKEEIAILNPDVVVFVTGPDYDPFLKTSFTGLNMNQLRDFKPREMMILEHDLLPRTSLRIYHPGYHNRLGKDYKCMLSKTIHDIYSNKF